MKKFRELVKESRVEDVGPPSVAAATLKDKPNKEPMPKLKEETNTPPIGVRSLYTKMYAKHGGTASKVKDAQSKAYAEVEKKHGKEMRNSLEAFHKKNMNEETDTTEKVEMTQSQLHFIHYACEEILDYIDDGGEVEEWYQVKVAKAFSEFESMHSFIEGEKRRTGMVKEDKERIDENILKKLADWWRSLGDEEKTKTMKSINKQKPVVSSATSNVKPSSGGSLSKSSVSAAESTLQRWGSRQRNEEVELDEISQNLALNTYAKRAAKASSSGSKEDQKKADTMIGRIGKRWTADAQRRAWNRADKLVYGTKKEEVEMLDELDKEPGGTLHRYLASPKQRQRRVQAAIENPSKLKKINKGMRSAETKIEKERQKQTGMNPQYQHPQPTPQQIRQMDMRYTHEQTESVPASKALQKAHDDERKKRGLPDPSYYLKLAAQKKKEIEDMKKEEVGLDEENKPTNPELWSRAVSMAKSKFDVYPSAYANGWAAKWYKEKGGGWKSVKEETELDEGYYKSQETDRQETERLTKRNELPFTPDKPKKKSVVVGKKPEGYSIARQLARQAMKKYLPVKEAEERGTEPFLNSSRKAEIVKGAAKKGQKSDKFVSDPVLSSTVTRNN